MSLKRGEYAVADLSFGIPSLDRDLPSLLAKIASLTLKYSVSSTGTQQHQVTGLPLTDQLKQFYDGFVVGAIDEDTFRETKWPRWSTKQRDHGEKFDQFKFASGFAVKSRLEYEGKQLLGSYERFQTTTGPGSLQEFKRKIRKKATFTLQLFRKDHKIDRSEFKVLLDGSVLVKADGQRVPLFTDCDMSTVLEDGCTVHSLVTVRGRDPEDSDSDVEESIEQRREDAKWEEYDRMAASRPEPEDCCIM